MRKGPHRYVLYAHEITSQVTLNENEHNNNNANQKKVIQYPSSINNNND